MPQYGTHMSERPELKGILETILYCDSFNEDKTREFYRDVLGFRQMQGLPFGYRAGNSNHVFLLFNRDETGFQDRPPAHGATGPVHTCFEAAPGTYDDWKHYLHSRGVAMRQEVTWGSGQRSIYFDDPAGNVLEMAEGDFWPEV